MRYGTLFDLLGKIILFLGFSLLLPLGWSFYAGESPWAFFWPFLFTTILGLGLFYGIKPNGDIRPREGFAVVGLGWLIMVSVGVFPYLISGTFTSFSDAFFESMSGFTTTGATVLLDIEGADRSILLWRSLTQWLGGMGIMALFVSILGQVGPGGMEMFRAEVPGPSIEKIKPRIKETAQILWVTYLILSLVQVVALLLADLDLFEALIHTFSTMSTGGFGSYADSIGAFDSAVHWIVTLFMFLAGINFSLYYVALRRRSLRGFWQSSEFRVYFSLLVFFSLFLMAVLGNEGAGFSDSVFQAVSITTTTGFVTADFNLWPVAAKGILLFLMFLGGSAGSTAGSIKIGRHLLLVRYALLEMQRLIRPRRVLSLRLEGHVISDRVMVNVMQFFFLYIFLVAFGTLVILTSGVDLQTAFSSVAACVGNIGPGISMVGPMENYAFFPPGYQIFLAFLMLIGRLEIFTILVLFLPNTWKK